MSRLLLLLSVVLASAGCSTCQNCFDGAYGHYGSIAPRSDRTCGRVGSAFAPAGPDVGILSPYVRETNSVGLSSGAIKSYSDKDKENKDKEKSPTPAEEPESGEPRTPPDSIDLPLTPSDT